MLFEIKRVIGTILPNGKANARLFITVKIRSYDCEVPFASFTSSARGGMRRWTDFMGVSRMRWEGSWPLTDDRTVFLH